MRESRIAGNWKKVLRRVYATVAGLLFAFVMFVVAIRDPVGLGRLLSSGSSSVAGKAPIYRGDLNLVAGTSYLGMTLASALVIALLFWDRRQSNIVETLIFAVLLFAVLTLSIANYMTGDFFVPVGQQALLDVILVFLGLICLGRLWRMNAISESAVIVKGIALFLLAFEAVLLPSFYGIVWLLVVQGALKLESAKSINPAWITAIAGVVSLVISAKKSIEEWRSQHKESTLIN